MPDTMQPLSHWLPEHRRGIVGVFTDIDDTLTTDGAITSDAVHALGQLWDAGLPVVAITGRPVGWSVPFARSWPVDAVVAENGAVALLRADAVTPACGDPVAPARGAPATPAHGGLITPARCGAIAPARGGSGESAARTGGELTKLYYLQDAQKRHAYFMRLQQVARRVLRAVPGALLSRDSPGRETDIAIDHSEFTHLGADRIAQVVRIMREEGMSATVSSIHINGWFGDHNKLLGARWIVRELFGRALDAEIGQWVYVGDSTNDQLMFEAFAQSVGVANIRRFESELTHLPRYITRGERGAGFAEVAQALLAVRPGEPVRYGLVDGPGHQVPDHAGTGRRPGSARAKS